MSPGPRKVRRFSAKIITTLVLFQVGSIALLVGVLYGVLSRSFEADFVHSAQVERSRIGAFVTRKLHGLDCCVHALSQDPAVREAMRPGADKELEGVLRRGYGSRPEGEFFILRRDPLRVTPELPADLATLQAEMLSLGAHPRLLPFERVGGRFVSLAVRGLGEADQKLGEAVGVVDFCGDTGIWDGLDLGLRSLVLYREGDRFFDLQSGRAVAATGAPRFGGGESGHLQIAAEKFYLLPLGELQGVHVAVRASGLEARRADLLTLLLVLCAFVLGLTLWLSVRIASGVARPLRRIVGEIQAVAADPDRRLAEDRLDYLEFRQVAQSLNQVLRALHQARYKAEQANDTKSAFLANMSHEIRTPMHGILSFAHFGIERAGDADPERHLTYYRHIEDCAQRLLGLVNDLLDLAKLESGQMVFRPEVCSLVPTLEVAMQEVSGLLEAKRIRLIKEGQICAESFRHDPGLMLQVLRNLLSNAVKFSPKGAEIRLEVLRLGDEIRIRVEDEGIGVPEDELESIFDKFVQSRSTQTGAGGTGLGLAICRDIVEVHGGRIWAERRKPVGAILQVSLPMLQTALVEGDPGGATQLVGR